MLILNFTCTAIVHIRPITDLTDAFVRAWLVDAFVFLASTQRSVFRTLVDVYNMSRT